MALLFDTHAHYDDEHFDADRDALLRGMREEGVGLILNPGCDEGSSRTAVQLADKYDFVYAAVGWHPENCAPYTDASLDMLREMAKHPKVRAIGEIGLDYHWAENPPREKQHEVFRAQLALARELSLPVIVHDRDAHEDCLAIVSEFPDVRGVFHCYSGSAEMARRLLDMGWYLGFDGPLTYKNARRAVETAEIAPMERILIETDAPYLPPVPHRGERNDSSLLVFVAQRLAGIKGVDAETIIRATAENGKRLFGIQ